MAERDEDDDPIVDTGGLLTEIADRLVLIEAKLDEFMRAMKAGAVGKWAK